MSDIFNEIDEELRQEKIKDFWQENKHFIIGSIIVAILFTAAFVSWQNWKYKTNMEATTKLYNILNTTDIGKLTTYAKKAKDEHAAIAKLSATTVYLNNNETSNALKLLSELKKDRNIDKTYRNLATLVEANLLIDTANPDELNNIEKELQPLTKKNAVWRFTANEILMLIASKQGRYKTAINIANKLVQDPNTRASMKERVIKLRKLYETKLAIMTKNTTEENN